MSLRYIFTQRDLNMRQGCWLEYLADFDFTLLYHPGKTSVMADELGRKKHIVVACVIVRKNSSVRINREVIMHMLGLCGLFSLVTQLTLIVKVREAQKRSIKG